LQPFVSTQEPSCAIASSLFQPPSLSFRPLTASLQSELNAFFPQLENRCDFLRTVSAQVSSKARKKVSFIVFSLLNQRLLSLVESTFAVPRWHGFRVVVGDASKRQLFLRDVTKRHVHEAIAFPPLSAGHRNEPCLSALLAFGRRAMPFEHLCYLQDDDLLLFDRGYPGNWLIALLTQIGRHFCMRVHYTGYACIKPFKRSGRSEQIVTLGTRNRCDCNDFGCREPTTVRLIRVITPNARQYVLTTVLLDSSLNSEDWDEAYGSSNKRPARLLI
jgi:hypothetical protein